MSDFYNSRHIVAATLFKALQYTPVHEAEALLPNVLIHYDPEETDHKLHKYASLVFNQLNPS